MTTESIATALAGGALIGIASALLLYFHNRVAGISGIAAGLLGHWDTESRWRAFFLAGLLISLPIYTLIGQAPNIRIDAPLPVLAIAGVLVGYGSRLGGGCTSGHGICGIARLSVRSIIATLVFMATAGVMVFVVRHLS